MLDVVCELLLCHFFEMQVTEWKPSIQITDAYAIKKQLYQIIQISIYLSIHIFKHTHTILFF